MRILFLAISVLLSTPFAAGAASTDALRSYFESVDTLTGRFEQATRDDTGTVVESAKGEFAIARPDRFNWFYETPFEQRIVADGHWLYVYDLELAQVTVRPLDDVLGVGAAVLLSGDYDALRDSFRIESGEGDWIRLVPKRGDWDFQNVRLRLSDGVPTEVEVNDGLGQTTRLVLKHMQRNVALEESRFHFDIPDDADVIAPPEFRADRQ